MTEYRERFLVPMSILVRCGFISALWGLGRTWNGSFLRSQSSGERSAYLIVCGVHQDDCRAAMLSAAR
jgi:hypothetical protein